MTKQAEQSFNEALEECQGDYMAFAEEYENQGMCCNCGHFQSYVEPDATDYECEECGKDKVQGILNLVL